MRTKRTLTFICCALVLIIAALSLTACLKISMKENSIKDRLTKAGAQIETLRTSPMTVEGQSGYSVDDILLAKMIVVDRVGEEDAEVEESLYIFFVRDSKSAAWVESKCKEYVSSNELANWNVYRYDTVIMCGHYKILTIARTY